MASEMQILALTVADALALNKPLPAAAQDLCAEAVERIATGQVDREYAEHVFTRLRSLGLELTSSFEPDRWAATLGGADG